MRSYRSYLSPAVALGVVAAIVVATLVYYLERLTSGMHRMELDMSALKSDVSGLKSDVSGLKSDVLKLKGSVDQFIDYSHNFHRAKVNVVASSTRSVQACPTQLGTSHAVFFKGRYANITVSHFNCSAVTPTGWIASLTADLALIPGCPKAPHALNLTNAVAELHLGDEVVAFGHAVVWEGGHATVVRRAWRGFLAGEFGFKVVPNNFKPFDGSFIKLPYEFVANSVQEGAMSGAAALNGCGYLGLVHATKLNNNQAIILPHQEIFKFLNENWRFMMPKERCPSVEPVSLPIAYGKSCI